MEVTISRRTVGPWEENAYMIRCGSDAWIIDPGDDFERLLPDFTWDGCTFRGIANTHGHFDHIGAVQQFKDHYQIPFLLHSADRLILRQANLYRKLLGYDPNCRIPKVDEVLDGKEALDLGGVPILIHHTPGHTFGSVCFEVENCLFSGDLLFTDGLGRSDLPGGSIEKLKTSASRVLDQFIGYNIYPGHQEPFVLTSAVADRIRGLL